MGAPLPRAQVVLRRALRRRCSSGRSRRSARFGRRVIETDFVQGTIVGGATGIVRVGTSFARAIQTGYLRAYALLLRPRRGRPDPLLPGQQLVTIHLSIILFVPLLTGLVGAFLPRDGARWAVLDRHADRARLRRRDAGRLRPVRRAPVRDRRRVDPRARHPLLARRGRAQPVHDRAHGDRLGAVHAGRGASPSSSGRGCSSSTSALAETAVLGAFMAQDLALFIVFFDLMLVPFYFLIGGWGTGDRVRATTKFVIYTLSGSLLMMAAAIALGVLATPDGGSISFSLADLQQRTGRPLGSQEWIVLLFALAFFVKAPLFPLHGWVPETYRSTSIPVLALLSGRAVEGRRLRLPADRAADHARRRPALAGAVHHPGGLLDPVRVGPGVLAGQHPAGARVLVDRAARLHRAGDLRLRRERRPGRAPPDAEPRARRGAAVPDRRRDRAASAAAASRSPSSAAWRSGRRCSRRCS